MNEILNQRIQSVQAGKDITHAQIVAKHNLRKELETEIEKFLANGGEIKQAVNQQFQVKHGTSDQYTKRGCRCDVCMNWALTKGKIKTKTLRKTA
ncbi:hypothetical protein RFI36_04790 [Acinetobacter gerneri]|uniref:Transcriptional regulator SutA RNAP-binding domain-containing protein n=1 Tax=Acinetobacter gerneri TaxID=202952 RepID=A0AAW8JIV2_9GAMM|nr:hypothetical protein [Acinetobacter gerneri]MDQ9009014.1 hypothetical protein [Acinetobacter gerneri]MDQ9013118.1 hypothetical protein [Acinetobacter gerneri]MDQ9024555.1 hypothetical protein [Acinetobacter gerneri]MDQ9051790.1 hypothetical protein [Acinetobacter gerneri]MDQ9059230.1 hypothetical protein [Acinetobacter gerneri]